jgi:hypothetical protein
MSHLPMGYIEGCILRLQLRGTVKRFISGSAAGMRTFQPKSAAQEDWLEGPVMADMDGKEADHVVRLKNISSK